MMNFHLTLSQSNPGKNLVHEKRTDSLLTCQRPHFLDSICVARHLEDFESENASRKVETLHNNKTETYFHSNFLVMVLLKLN